MCICDSLRGITCAVHAEQARAAAAGQPLVDEDAARAAGWVPLAEALDALRDQERFVEWTRRAGPSGYINDYVRREFRKVCARYLAERFGGATAGPRTWTQPPEPGPQVTALTDRYGRRWERHPDGWRLDAKTPLGIPAIYTWPILFEIGQPLTDATSDPATRTTP